MKFLNSVVGWKCLLKLLLFFFREFIIYIVSNLYGFPAEAANAQQRNHNNYCILRTVFSVEILVPFAKTRLLVNKVDGVFALWGVLGWDTVATTRKLVFLQEIIVNFGCRYKLLFSTSFSLAIYFACRLFGFCM